MHRWLAQVAAHVSDHLSRAARICAFCARQHRRTRFSCITCVRVNADTDLDTFTLVFINRKIQKQEETKN